MYHRQTTSPGRPAARTGQPSASVRIIPPTPASLQFPGRRPGPPGEGGMGRWVGAGRNPPALSPRGGAGLNHLAARIGELLAHERETVADLSHRLRTPLTALRFDA